MKVVEKVIVVTGGGNGMGRELVLNLLMKGAKVAAVDIDNESLLVTKKLAKEFQDNLSIHVMDISDKSAVDAFPGEVISLHGTVDGIINNAGIIQPFLRVGDLDFSLIDRVMNIDFYGVLFMTKAFLPYLQERPEAHIVNISSMGGFLPVPGQCIYGASKAGVKIFTEGLRAELESTNIDVTVVFPGAIDTNIKVNSGAEEAKAEKETANGKITSPEQAAQLIVESMEKNKSRLFVGSDSRILDFLYRVSPDFATNLISRQMKHHIPQSA